MLDKLMIHRGVRNNVLSSEAYSPDEAITSEQLLNPGGQNLTVLLPPWHGGGKFYERLTQRLITKNEAVLAYDFHDEILKPDEQMVVDSFRKIQSEIGSKLHEITESKRYESTRLIAASLGTPILAMVASAFSGFDRAAMVTPGTDLAKCMWDGARTVRVREGLEARGVPGSN